VLHGIAIKPGKPTILGKRGSKAVIGLPGHPASAYTVFNIFVGRLIKVMSGSDSDLTPVLIAEMSCNYPSNNGREEFLPVSVRKAGGKLIADPVFGKSGLVTLLTEAIGYVHISRGSEGINRGAIVEVILF
jgi:molybdopterin molybdotransferase